MKKIIFSEEYYVCRECDTKFEDEDIEEKWRCPSCHALLRIYVKDGNQNRVFIRKSGNDIKINDLVDIPESGYDFHNVLNNQKSGGVSEIALKNHGVVKLGEGDWLNCIQGRWDGNVDIL